MKTSSILAFAGLLLLPLSLVEGCGSSQSSSNDANAGVWGTDPACNGVFASSCALSGCHASSQPAAGLNLSGDVASATVGVASVNCQNWTLVVAGDPERSLLYRKVFDTTPPCGSPMPLGGHLDAVQLGCVRTWIQGLGSNGASGTGGSTSGTGGSASGTGGSASGTGGTGGTGGTTCNTCGGAACVDLQTDSSNCGSCGNACASGTTCSSGVCCASGQIACGGTCVDNATDTKNCGACGNDCGSGTCSNGSCTCAGSLTNCGACVDLQTDPANCGKCGQACGSGESCVNGACQCQSGTASFKNDIMPVLLNSCATTACHGGARPAEGLDLSSASTAYTGLMAQATECSDGRLRVSPGKPASSYVINKLTGTNLCFGSQMPKTGSIPQSQVDLITGWVCAGAANN